MSDPATTPTDPQAAIGRLRAMLHNLKGGAFTTGLKRAYAPNDTVSFSDACAAFAADIETLASLTQVGWGIGYTDGKGRGVELQELRTDGSGPKLSDWFPVYARVPS